ncbi:MAG TPA: hypothetical protein VHN99_07345 [Deinococcales bacterium]|nr:hypothetical protein [Deinococcales bacterium]
MRRPLPLALAALALLAGCAAYTRLTLSVDVAALLPENALSAPAPATAGTYRLLVPSGSAGYTLDLPRTSAMDRIDFQLEAAVEVTSGTPGATRLSLYVAPGGTDPLAAPANQAAQSDPVTLTPGQATPVSLLLNVPASPPSALHDLIAGGQFEIQAEASGTSASGSVQVTLTRLRVQLSGESADILHL